MGHTAVIQSTGHTAVIRYKKMCLIKLHCNKKVKDSEREISIRESQIIILLGAY